MARDGALAQLWMTPFAVPDGEPPAGADAAVLEAAEHQLNEYFEGRLTEFDLPLALEGTTFQRGVWDELVRIPFGETISYAEVRSTQNNLGAVGFSLAEAGKSPVKVGFQLRRPLTRPADPRCARWWTRGRSAAPRTRSPPARSGGRW